MMQTLQELIAQLEAEDSLLEPSKLRQRMEALDRLDACPAADCRAQSLQAKLETANLEIYEAIRHDIQQGCGSRSLLQWMPGPCGDNIASGGAFDDLDELIAGVLRFAETEARLVPLAPEMVFYQPTPVRHICDLIQRTALNEDDVLVDLGSGLGHVPLLASICTSARSIGIELEPAYVECARQTAAALNLRNVTFVQKDARAAQWTEGTVFYLYTPFTGNTLRAVLDSLQPEGVRRDIRICTFGPCTHTVAGEDWLQVVGVSRPDRVSIFRCRCARSS